MTGNVEIAKLLIDNGAKITAINQLGVMPLYYATNEEMEKLLIAGAFKVKNC